MAGLEPMSMEKERKRKEGKGCGGRKRRGEGNKFDVLSRGPRPNEKGR